MEEFVEMQEEIRLSDVFKTLFRKIKLLILVFLAGIIAGGALGFAFDFNQYYYGGTVEFYVNPKKSKDETGEKIYGAYGQTAMNDMVRLLNSQLFAEYLFLDENGLPETTSSEELNAKIENAKTLLEDDTLSNQERAAIVEEIIDEWRTLDTYKELIEVVEESTTYSHTLNSDDKNATASSFIVVEVSVLNNEEFANALFARVKAAVESYVEKNMFVPPDYVGTRCRKVTNLDQVELLNSSSLIESIVKYAILVGVATLLIAAVIILIKDSSDKRLKSPAQTMSQLDVPVLSVIPQEDQDNLQ